MHIGIYVYVYSCIHVYMHIYIYICMYICIYVYMHIYIHTCIYEFTYIHVCIYANVSVYILCVGCNMLLSTRRNKHIHRTSQKPKHKQNSYSHLTEGVVEKLFCTFITFGNLNCL